MVREQPRNVFYLDYNNGYTLCAFRRNFGTQRTSEFRDEPIRNLGDDYEKATKLAKLTLVMQAAIGDYFFLSQSEARDFIYERRA